MAMKLFLLLTIFVVVSRSSDIEQQGHIEMMAKIIAIMQQKINRLEKAEADMKRSIGALVSTTAQFRVKNMELEERLVKCESVAKEESKIPDSDGQCEERDRGKRQVPEYVAFSAYLSHVVRSVPLKHPVVYDTVLFNQAGAYDKTTGIFTVPTPGIYLFSWSVTARQLTGEAPYDARIRLVINGVHQLGAVAESRHEHDDNQGSSTVILQTHQGDRVWLEPYGGTDLFGSNVERTSSFVGVLLFEISG